MVGFKKKKKKAHYLDNNELLKETLISKEQGQMTNRLAGMIIMLVDHYGTKGNVANYCVDSDTEALTKEGWKSYNKISKCDMILSYDIKSGQLKWSKVIDVYINTEYDGMMHHLTTRGMDALVSPNHKFVSKERGLVTIEEMICDEHIILTGDSIVNTNEEIYDDNFVELVGWAVTEGHYRKDSKIKKSISISQKIGNHADRIRNCLQENHNVSFKEYEFVEGLLSFHCKGNGITEIYDNVAPNKILSYDFIVSLTHKQRLLLIETMINGDGWFRPNGRMSYTQKCKKHIDVFLMLCTMSGLITSTNIRSCKTHVSKIKPNGGTSKIYTINVFPPNKKQCKAEKINFHGGRTTPEGRKHQKENTPTVKYKGVIWCPQTEYKTFVCRRNKYIYVTGNTYNDDMRAYAIMMHMSSWKSFKPEKSTNAFAFFTQCTKNSFRQFLNKERRQRDIRDELLIHQGLDPSHTYSSANENIDETDYNDKTPTEAARKPEPLLEF